MKRLGGDAKGGTQNEKLANFFQTLLLKKGSVSASKEPLDGV